MPGSRTRIVDTRKTLPGLRLAQKYAVYIGGGLNHRLGLYDAVLIKENHIAAAGGVKTVLARAAELAPQAKFIEIEVETLEQLQEALEAGATMILLDNMGLMYLHEAVRITAGRAVLEERGAGSLGRGQPVERLRDRLHWRGSHFHRGLDEKRQSRRFFDALRQ